MKKKIAIALSMSFIFTGNVWADAKSGFGLNFGSVSNHMASTITVASPGLPVGTAKSYDSSGISIGIDYQIAFSPDFSLNPFLMSSGEDATGDVNSGTMAGHGIFGIQGRYWLGNWFFGAHVANYSEVLTQTTNTTATTTTSTTTAAAGRGEGLVIGWEPSSSKWFLMLQGDYAKIKFADADVDLTGARLSIGYRWK